MSRSWMLDLDDLNRERREDLALREWENGRIVQRLRRGERGAALAACEQAEAIDGRGVERLRRADPRSMIAEPFSLTPSQLRAVQQLLALCDRSSVTPPESR